ncbi:MAG: choice-of-anchor D domain-containing protein [Verrucomicrobiota bacterium]
MRYIISSVLGLALLASGVASVHAEGSFRTTGSLSQHRRLHTATLLANGKVLVCGGIFDAPGTGIASAELFDSQSGTWSQTAPLHSARYNHTATLLTDGRVLVAGGYGPGIATLNSAEIYDPASGTWSNTGEMNEARHRHTATLLQNGRVLVVAGSQNDTPTSKVEIYDPVTQAWTVRAALAGSRSSHSAGLLPDGRVLVTGGWGGQTLNTIERYDPAANTWTSLPAMLTASYSHGQVTLADGRILVGGGFGLEGSILAATALFDPATQTWASAGSLAAGRVEPTFTRLLDEQVLATGGFTHAQATNTADLFDPVTKQWRLISPLRKGRNQHTATLLPDGRVLIVGGTDATYRELASAELYDPAQPPQPAWLRVNTSEGSVIEDGGTAYFREVAPAEQTVVSLTVTNTGLSAQTGLRWTLERAAAGVFALASPPVETLAAGETATFKVMFMPDKAAEHRASLRIDQGNANTTLFVMDLAGPCADHPLNLMLEEVSVSGMNSVVDFGSTEIGTSVRKTFRLTNISGRTFTGSVQVPSLFGIGHILWPRFPARVLEYPYAGFAIVAPSRLTLRPGAKATFDVVFNPASTETVTQTVQVVEDLTGTVKRSFQVTGKGACSGGLRDQVVYRLGDAQSTTVISGAPVTSEYGLLFGRPDAWDGWYGRRISIFLGQYGFAPRLTAPMVTGPVLLPLSDAGVAGSPISSRAALHFTEGDLLIQPDFGFEPTWIGLPIPGGGAQPWAQSSMTTWNLGMQIWVRAEDNTGTHPVVQVGNPEGDGMGIWQVDGMFRGRLAQGVWVGEAPVQVGTWQHLALVNEGMKTTLYLNGQAVGPTSDAPIQAVPNPWVLQTRVQGLKLGGALSAGSSSFTGDLDELQFFTLSPGTLFSPQAELASGAQPELRVQSTPPPTRAIMVGTSITYYTEITNAGSGMATLSPQTFEGDAAADYRLEWSGLGTWQDGSSGTQTTRTLAPGERWVLPIMFKPRAAGLRAATLRLLTTDPDLPEIVLSFAGQGSTAEPRLAISQTRSEADDEVTFGTVLLGTTFRTNVYLTNVGGLDLNGLSARVTGAQAERFEITPVMPYYQNDPASPVPPGKSDYVMISYTPDAADIDTAWLEITSNDPQAPLKTLLLSGRGVPPTPDIQVSVADSEVSTGTVTDFGSAYVNGAPGGKPLSLRNVGTGPLNFSSLRFEGADAGDFFLRYPGVYDGSVLEPGEGRPAGIIEFTPTAVGVRSARLVIGSNDPDESSFVIQLTGEGVPPESEIAVLDGTQELVSGSALLHLGHATPGGAAVTRQLKIRNTGGAPLTGLSMRLTGRHATAFQVSGNGGGTLAPNSDLDISATFTARDLGPHGATLIIDSNDGDESRYVIELGGTGAYGDSSLLRPELADWTTTAMAEAADGSVLLTGFTVPASGVKTHFVRRVARDGTEAARNAGSITVNQEIKAIALQPDGRVLITGDFSLAGLLGRQGIARLNVDGTLDLSFVPPTGDFAGRDVLVLPGGKIMVAGSGSLGSRANLVRLNANGTLDASFKIQAPNGPVNALALESDGSVLVGGAFTNDLQSGLIMITLGGNLRRLTPDGQVDPLFGFTRLIYDIVTHGDDIYVAHRQQNLGLVLSGTLGGPGSMGQFSDQITRLSHTGSVMAMQDLGGFNSVAECLPRTLAFQPGGGLLVAPGPSFWGTPDIQQISRYRSGTLAVDPGFYGVAGSPANIRALQVQADGKVLVGGKFSGVNAWMGAWTLGPPPPATTGQPGFADGGPASGFAQLTHQGDFRPDIRLTEAVTSRPLSDGLSTLEMRVDSGDETSVVLNVASILNLQPVYPSTSPANLVAEFEGPNAGDFSAEIVPLSPPQQITWNTASLTLRFRPSASGVRHAKVRLSLESLTLHGYAQNAFELNLRGSSGPMELPNHLTITQSTSLVQTSLVDTSVYDRFEARGLPPGMTMNPITGQVTGRATRPGNYVVTIRSRDKITRIFTTRTMTLTVQAMETAGQYLGLLERTAAALNGRGGLLALTLTSSGTWSGSLQANLAADRTIIHRFSGVLTVLSPTEVSGSVSIPRPGLTPLALAFDVRDGVLAVQLGGVIAGRGGKVIGQSSLAGTCHLGIVPASNVPDRLVSGYARGIFTRGTMTLAGRLAHAVRPEVRTLVQSTAWISDGNSGAHLPLFTPLTRGETVSGWLRLESGSTTLLSSSETAWNVPPSPGDAIVPWAGGDAALMIRGGLWRAPLPGARLLGAGTSVPNARISVGPSSQEFTLTATHQARPVGTTWPKSSEGGVVQVLVTGAAGTFSGQTWTVPYRTNMTTALPAMPGGSFSGLIIPGLNQGMGLFLSLERAPAGRYPEATPDVTIEVLE